jgi:hypothetical protein
VNKDSKYVFNKFGHAAIVFDGYPDGPSTKDITHLRRSKGLLERRVTLSNITSFNSKKKLFLSNIDNKKQFIALLGQSLEENGCIVLYARGDADTLIAKRGIDKSLHGPVAVNGEDTDLLVLLIHYIDPITSNDVIFYSDHQSKENKIWDIRRTHLILPRNISRHLTLIHAITGCDTTSRVYGIGKLQSLKKFINNPSLNEMASVFFISGDSKPAKEDIASAGESIICILFSGMDGESLDQLLYRKFITKVVACKSSIQVHELPPTISANCFTAYEHTCIIKFSSGLGMS